MEMTLAKKKFFFFEWKRNGERNAFWNGMAMEKLNVLGMGIRM